MDKLNELIPVFCKYIPKWQDMKHGILYISDYYKISNHLCACGCGHQTPLPFTNDKEFGDNWSMTNNEGKISLVPSIGNFSGENPYHAHYLITDNKVIWC